jgi:hypothetical protein
LLITVILWLCSSFSLMIFHILLIYIYFKANYFTCFRNSFIDMHVIMYLIKYSNREQN